MNAMDKMNSTQRRAIEEFIQQRKPGDFECYNLEVGPICKAKDIGIEHYVECLEENPEKCNFSFPFGHWHICRCSLRIYVAKELKK